MKKVKITFEQTCRLTRQVVVDDEEYEAMIASSDNGDTLPDEDECPEVWSAYEDVDFGDRAYQCQVFDADNPETPVAEWANSDFPGYTVHLPVCLGQSLYGMVYGELTEATVSGITYQAYDNDIQHEQEIQLFFRESSAGCKMNPVIEFSDIERLWFYTADEAKAHPVCTEPWRYLQM